MSYGAPRLPKTIKIVVHDGRNLEYRVPDTKTSPKTRRWRVIFIGGEKKQATSIIDAQDGFPKWDCEVSISTPKPTDYVSMLVVDGKERHVGQVVLRLLDIPVGPAPALVISQLQVKDLEPTKHNSRPAGQLSFWIWAVDYWPEGTTVPSMPPQSSHSFKGSMSQLGSAFKVHSSKADQDAASHGSKFHGVKGRYGRRAGSKSNFANSNNNSPDKTEPEGSAIMGYGEGVSVLSGSHGPLGWASEIGGASGISYDLGDPSSTPPSVAKRRDIAGSSGVNSYNPLASPEEENAPSASITTNQSPSTLGDAGLGSRPTSMWAGAPIPGDSASMVSPEGSAQGYRKKGALSKLKAKVSKSTASISEIQHRRSRRSSPDGSRGDGEHPADTRFSASTTPNHENRPPQMPKSDWGLPDSNTGKNSQQNPSGWHAEEGPGKSKADMSKRELVELSNVLEQRLMTARTELVRVNMDQERAQATIDELNAELESARTQLSDLRNRLLADNMTQYLEVDSGSRKSISAVPDTDDFSAPHTTASTMRLNQMKSGYQFGLGETDQSATNEPSQHRFLGKAKAVLQKPFNQNPRPQMYSGLAASQPNLAPISASANNGYGNGW